MKSESLYKEILDLLGSIRNDSDKLMKVLNFLENQFLNEYTTSPVVEIPEEYMGTVSQIADAIEEGVVCYLNPETMEIEQVSEEIFYDPEVYQEQNDDMMDEYNLDYMKWDNYIKFEPLGKDELYNMMQKFVDMLDDEKLIGKLENALEKDNPTGYFSDVIHNTIAESFWQRYKREETMNYINTRLQEALQIH